MRLTKLLTLGLVVMQLLPLTLTYGQPNHSFIALHVKHDGKNLPSPEKVTLIFEGQSLTLPVRAGRFEVPPAALRATKLSLLTRLNHERLTISGISASELRQADWTLILADQQYDADNQWVVPKGASVRSSCIVIFESKSTEGTALFEPNCRHTMQVKATRK